MADASLPDYSLAEELAHSVTHGIGTLLALGGLAVLLSTAKVSGNGSHLISGGVFGATLVLAYFFSTLYHGLPSRQLKPILRMFDESAIFLLIAGTYTPFTLITLRDDGGHVLLTVVWVVALSGITFTVVAHKKFRAVSTSLYLSMGWIGAFAVKPLISALHPDGFLLLVLGGVSYTVGVVFYCWRRLPFNHAIWHVFAMAGSAFHFAVILLYVLPTQF